METNRTRAIMCNPSSCSTTIIFLNHADSTNQTAPKYATKYMPDKFTRENTQCCSFVILSMSMLLEVNMEIEMKNYERRKSSHGQKK